MSESGIPGWELLRHGGLLLDPARASKIGEAARPALYAGQQIELRKQTASLLDGGSKASEFVRYVLEKVCGFGGAEGTWSRGTDIATQWGRRLATGETAKPRLLWQGHKGALLPVFLEDKTRGGQGRRAASQVVQWLRAGGERLALLTSGSQWRLIYAGLDADAWCEWDAGLWLEEGTLSPQVDALRTLIQPSLWTPAEAGSPSPLLQAVLDSRKGQAELSAVLGDRVREAVELLLQAHGDALREHCSDVPPADIYRAAVRVIMRMVVVLFAESRELLPRDNALYQGAYGLNGLRDELDKSAARGGNRLARSWNSWPRVLSLFRLVHAGSHHEALPVPEYGGELFEPAKSESHDGLTRALHVFETAALDHEVFPDRDVHKVLGRITTTRVKVRQGHSATWVAAPVDFSDLSSEYIGILYEGLLDFELKTAPAGDPVVFLAVGEQPALPLSRLEEMDDKALKNLLEKMKDTSKKGDEEEEGEEGGEPDTASAETEPEEAADGATDEDDTPPEEETSQDNRQVTRTRAETWARSAALAGGLVKKPKAPHTAQKQAAFEEALGRKAKQLVVKVILPGEWYVVRWGGTRKGSGTFYTRPGLAIPTTRRTLWPLAYVPPAGEDGTPDFDAPHAAWAPKKPEEILALKVCDPGCGSGTFPVAALRFLTEALFASLHYHGRVKPGGDHVVMHLLQPPPAAGAASFELLGEERLPCRPEDPSYEPRMKAILRRYVVERCIYGVDLDPLAVELCRLALWVETMDRTLPFSFLDHKVKCGNSLIGAWFDQFQHYPLMAWKGREGGDKGHNNGVHFQKEARGKALKEFASDRLKLDIASFLRGRNLFSPDLLEKAGAVHADALATLSRLHDLPVQDTAERARIYRVELIEAPAYRALKAALDLWCACWFWPADDLSQAPLPTTFSAPSAATWAISAEVAAKKRFFHWELEFPDVFRAETAGFDAILGNPPWDIAKPNSKEFFSNIDPLYRAYGKQEAIACQKSYFQQDAATERQWLDYNADFRAQSNFVGASASPFGDPAKKEDGWDSFSIESGKGKNAGAHDRWRQARGKTRGFADVAHPFRHQGSADLNLYKTFLEQAHTLLRTGGRLGFIVPSGLYSDHGTGHLRRLFLDHCRWEWLFGFENREAIFDIHRSFKFNPIIIEKGGQTIAIRTAFMRRKLEDWESAEAFATPYARTQVDRFSPRSKSILEIQSQRDLEILEKIYSNSVLLGDQGPDGWGITYSTEFHMTNDSALFPPRTKWEEQGYKPDEYSRWIKGNWRPIAELWKEMDIDPSRIVPIDPECEKEIARRGADVQRTTPAVRCAQPPYDTLPIPRADIPTGIILSRNGDEWIREADTADAAVPLYEGRMIDQFDFSAKGWVSGKGRTAVWREIEWGDKRLEPQYLMSQSDVGSSAKTNGGPKIAYMRISSATNSRTTISTYLRSAPAGDSVFFFLPSKDLSKTSVVCSSVLSSLAFDVVLRQRLGGLNMSEFVMVEAPLPHRGTSVTEAVEGVALGLGLADRLFAREAIESRESIDGLTAWRRRWSLTGARRLERRVSLDALVCLWYGLDEHSLVGIFEDCDWPVGSHTAVFNAKGFWRVDKEKEPELRHTVLTLVAFHDLQKKIRALGGDQDKGIEAFLAQNNGEGWMLPETLRLADYELGHDDRARQPQPVASRLGPRFYDWQLAQTADESWRECHLHARNLLGDAGYGKLLADVEAERNGTPATPTFVAESTSRYQTKPQAKLF